MSVMNTSQARELGRQEIDQKIQDISNKLLRILKGLKTRRNALAHISFLPTEILSRIFMALVYLYWDNSDLSWIPSVTAVCSHWRAVALECPSLWCYISFSWPIWVEEMLKRSKMVPLIIKADNLNPTTKQMDAIRLVLQHISRIKELRLTAPGDTIAELINPIDEPAPLLQSLHLSDPLGYYLWGDLYMLPERLFVCDGHHLQRLELMNCNIPWESPLLSGLVHFKFYTSITTTTRLLETLEKMPLLETLDLGGPLTIASDDTRRVVHLSHLTSLRLFSTSPPGLSLNDISFPASTSLALRYRLLSVVDDYSAVCNAVSSVWNGKDGSKLLRCLFIQNTSTTSKRLRGWTSETTDGQPSGPAQIDIELSWPRIGNIIIDICNSLTLDNLRTLLVFDAYLTNATWLSDVSHLTSLRRVFLGGWSLLGFVSALSIWSKERLVGNDSMEILLPGLHDLWIYKADMEVVLEVLRDFLMSRCHWNVEVQELYLLDCRGLYRNQVELLEEIVVYVDWIDREVSDSVEDEDDDLC
jgi:hypothetical protein